MSDWGDEVIRHKYDPLPDEPRYRKKAKKRHVRSDHKHEYEDVCVDAHGYTITSEGRFPYYHIARRCKVCGRTYTYKARVDMHEPPKNMKLFEVKNWVELWRARELPDESEVTP